ncbi:hypothetical protein [Methanobrevibacter cuticularis]|nr:hypothetical protein [Methanobrevibacter cuticularis]
MSIKLWKLNNKELLTTVYFDFYPSSYINFSSDGKYLIVGFFVFKLENIEKGIAIVTPIYELDKNISLKCIYCNEEFNINEEDLGSIIKCFKCSKKLNVNSFTGNKKQKKGFLSKLFGKK